MNETPIKRREIVFTRREYEEPILLKPQELKLIQDDASFFSSLLSAFAKIPLLKDLILSLIKLYREAKMATNQKDATTNKYAWVATLLVVVNTILGFFNFGLSPEVLGMVQTAVTSIIGAVIAVIAYYTGKPNE